MIAFEQSTASVYHVENAMCVMIFYASFCKYFTTFALDIKKCLQDFSIYFEKPPILDYLKPIRKISNSIHYINLLSI